MLLATAAQVSSRFVQTIQAKAGEAQPPMRRRFDQMRAGFTAHGQRLFKGCQRRGVSAAMALDHAAQAERLAHRAPMTDATRQLHGLVHKLACLVVCTQMDEICGPEKLIGHEIAHVFIVLPVFRRLHKTCLGATVLAHGVVHMPQLQKRRPGARVVAQLAEEAKRLLQIRDREFEEFLIFGRAAQLLEDERLVQRHPQALVEGQRLGQPGARFVVPALQPQVATHGEKGPRAQRVRPHHCRLFGRKPQPGDGLLVMPLERQAVAPFQLRHDDESRVILRFGRFQDVPSKGDRLVMALQEVEEERMDELELQAQRVRRRDRRGDLGQGRGSRRKHCLALTKGGTDEVQRLQRRCGAVDGSNIPVRDGQVPGAAQMLDFRQKRLQGRPLLHAVESVTVLRQQTAVVVDEAGRHTRGGHGILGQFLFQELAQHLMEQVAS